MKFLPRKDAAVFLPMLDMNLTAVCKVKISVILCLRKFGAVNIDFLSTLVAQLSRIHTYTIMLKRNGLYLSIFQRGIFQLASVNVVFQSLDITVEQYQYEQMYTERLWPLNVLH